jgi:hypothetical protein
MTQDTFGHLGLLLPVARYAGLHGIGPRFTQQSAMSYVRVALKALYIVGHMGFVIDLVAGVLGHNILNFVALRASSCVDFASEDGPLVIPCQANHYITCAVQMGLELSDNARLGMTVNAIGLGMDRPGMSGPLPTYIARLHYLATGAEA